MGTGSRDYGSCEVLQSVDLPLVGKTGKLVEFSLSLKA